MLTAGEAKLSQLSLITFLLAQVAADGYHPLPAWRASCRSAQGEFRLMFNAAVPNRAGAL
jgi:hypothetical protein